MKTWALPFRASANSLVVDIALGLEGVGGNGVVEGLDDELPDDFRTLGVRHQEVFLVLEYVVHDGRTAEHVHKEHICPRADDLGLGDRHLHRLGIALGEMVDNEVAAVHHGEQGIVRSTDVLVGVVVGVEHEVVGVTHLVTVVTVVHLVGNLTEDREEISVELALHGVVDSGIHTGEGLEACLVRSIEVLLAGNTLLRDVQTGLVTGNGCQRNQCGYNNQYIFFHILCSVLE